jgi:hypothetical protein
MRSPSGTHGSAPAREDERGARLRTLRLRWDEFAAEYEQARARNDQQLMTNVRGLMVLIKREMQRLGGALPDFLVRGRAHLGDL